MTPSQLSAQLRHIAAKISNSKSPRRDLVARDLKKLVNKLTITRVADLAEIPEISELPDREPDNILDDSRSDDPEWATKKITKFWDLGGNRQLEVDYVGTRRYTKNGEPHRDDGPAIEDVDGYRAWYKDGQLHREGDEPAIQNLEDGIEEWWVNGKEHRENGPAYILGEDTDYEQNRWYLNGQLHRVGGPAVDDANGDKEWYLNGKRHREDGPAVEDESGTAEYWLNDQQVKPEDFDNPSFQKKYPKLVEDYQSRLVEQVMED